ncbi:MAG: pilus assembly protein TadG-related protein [Actinomycetota bacterium]|nr:pilus assembly protein TadG-related protein [Actinomycetota bacterium]
MRDVLKAAWCRRRQSEDGAVAIMVAVSLTMLMVSAAMVLDFGLVRLDRQMNKSSADTAAAAGIHGLDRGNGKPHPFAGVCQALRFLKTSQTGHSTEDIALLPDVSAPPGNVACPASAAQLSTVCDPDNSATWARYEATVGRLHVQIKSPYLLSDGGFPEESLSTLQGDTGDPTLNGCDQLGVIVTETERPGLGSLATSSDLVSRVRSVGRIEIGDEGQGAVALLVLERNNCAVIDVSGTNAGVLVKGFDDVPGLIHSDSLGNGSSCGTGSNIMNGNHTDGIVAQEAETGAPQLPGIIGVRALSGEPGAVPAKAADPIPEVYAGPYPPGSGPTARGLITRSPVDDRYLAAVRSAITTQANPEFARTPATAPAAGYTVVGCTPTAAQQALTTPVFVDCPGNPGFRASNVTFQSNRIVFNGKIDAANLAMPNATEVYVAGYSGAGIKADGFRMHHQGAATCSDAPSADSARLFVRDGAVESTGGLLQMCHTTVILMGGKSDGCLPTTPGTAPTTTPCAGVAGSGVVKIAGTASQDWTAPDAVSGTATAADWANLEDLALWTETYGAGPTFSMTGSGSMHLSGVFMIPNADPFNIKGGGVQQVENSQYVARRLNVTGTGILTMRPDPHDVVTIPIIGGFSLVR